MFRPSSFQLKFFFALVILCSLGGESSGRKLRAEIVDGLVAHWKLDEESGLVAKDSSGHGNNGTLVNFPSNQVFWADGRKAGALVFNGEVARDQEIIVPDDPELDFAEHPQFSIALWVKNLGEQTLSGGILCKGFGSGGEQYSLDVVSGGYRFFVRTKDGRSAPSVIAPSKSTGRWQHLAVTIDSSTMMAIYLDGALVTTNANPPSKIFVTQHPISIGSREFNEASGYNLPFRGMLDDVRIYNRALTVAEIQEIHSAAGFFQPTVRIDPKSPEVFLADNVRFIASGDGVDPLWFQWQKDGVDIPGAKNMNLSLINLKSSDAGIYTVKLTAGNAVTVSSSVRLEVKSFIWQTWWFKCLFAFFSITGVAGTVHLIGRRKAQRALERLEKVHAVDRERMRIARDMHDEIGAKLSRISFLSDLAKRSVDEESLAGRQIEEVSDAAREVIQTVDEIVWAVNPRNDTLESLIHYICRHAEEFFELTPIELTLNLPGKFPVRQLSADVRHNLFCATKEALNNALKHSGATKLAISFVLNPASLQITIRDNGQGFDLKKVVEESTTLNKGRRGNGVINLEERLKSISGNASIRSALGEGTMIELRAPYEEEKMKRN